MRAVTPVNEFTKLCSVDSAAGNPVAKVESLLADGREECPLFRFLESEGVTCVAE